MKKIFLIILITYSFTNCKNISEELKVIENLNEENKTENHSPLFLGLTPSMSDYKFSEEIKNLNKINKLDNGRFIIPIKNEEFYFEVQKTKNTIRLNCKNQDSIAIENLSYQISEEYLEKYNREINNIIEVFDKKYNGQKLIMPTNISLLNYGLQNDYYKIFQDSSKTVLIGYKKIGYKHPSPSERKAEDNKIKKKNPYDPLESIGEIIDGQKDSSNFVVFGFEMDIDYYYNKEFNKIFKAIQIESKNNNNDRIEKLNSETEKKKHIKE